MSAWGSNLTALDLRSTPNLASFQRRASASGSSPVSEPGGREAHTISGFRATRKVQVNRGSSCAGDFLESRRQTDTTFSCSAGASHERHRVRTRTGDRSRGGGHSAQNLQEEALDLINQCHEYLKSANKILQSNGSPMEAERLMGNARELMEELTQCSVELEQMRISSDVFAKLEQLKHMLASIQQQFGIQIRSDTVDQNGSSLFDQAMAWIAQQRQMIKRASFGVDSATVVKQISGHQEIHRSLVQSSEVENAIRDLKVRKDKYELYVLEQEWKSLQKMSDNRLSQLCELENIIEEVTRAIMWVNEREEKELVFDWGDKNIDNYIPKKQESYSRLIRDLEEKEKELNQLLGKADGLLSSNHPASHQIKTYVETLQVQWRWLLEITKCIDVHLKENAAYSQFFKEVHESNTKLQKEFEIIQTSFIFDENTPMENLQNLLIKLEEQRECIIQNRGQVQSQVNKSKSIVCLKSRYPEEKSSYPVIVKALCDFKLDQIAILKGDEAILKDTSQRSKWLVTGPGGLDMLIPSVCLLIPPPNPLSTELANENEQNYETIMGIWNQLYINIRSLILWQYCFQDIFLINSMTLSTLNEKSVEEYRITMERLEIHYQEFLLISQGSDRFGEEDSNNIRSEFDKALAHYHTIIIQLPSHPSPKPEPDPLIGVALLNSLHDLMNRLHQAETALTSHLHVPIGQNSLHECSLHIQKLQLVHKDLDIINAEYLRLREGILKQMEGIPPDSEQTKFLHVELEFINHKLGGLQGLHSSYLQRLTVLKALLQSLLRAEDVIKVHEARLTEKETTSLDLNEIEHYRSTLKLMQSDLEHKKDLLNSLESNLATAMQCNAQISDSFHKCDSDLSKYSDLVNQMIDRWRHILTQAKNRMLNLEKQEKQLRHYQQTRSSLEQWIDNARKRQDNLQLVKLNDIQTLTDHLNQQKLLHTEIKDKKYNIEDLRKNADTCAASIKDYELQVASYGTRLETLLKIPIKKTMLQSPASVVRAEAGDLQSRYIELLTHSGDCYKFLGELFKNSEELKIRYTKIEILEEDLRRLKETLQECNLKNKHLDEELTQYNDQTTRLKYQLEEEKRKRIMAEERYTSMHEKNEATLSSRQELEQLKLLLEEETARRRTAESENFKIRSEYSKEISQLKQTYETITHVTNTTILNEPQQNDRLAAEKRDLEEELTRLRLSIADSEEQKRRAEEEANQQRLSVTRETRARIELEVQIINLKQQREEDARQISDLTFNLEEDERKRRALELELNHFKQSEADLKAKNASYVNTLNKTNITDHEMRITKIQLEELSSEKNKAEQNSARLQNRIQELQGSLYMMEAELEKHKKSAQDEFTRRKNIEAELEKMNEIFIEHTTTITSLRSQIVEIESTSAGLKYEQEVKILKEERQKCLTEHKRTKDELNAALAEITTLKHMLQQEQANLKAKNASYVETINKMKVIEHEMELEKQSSEKNKAEQNSARLQNRIQELQCSLDTMEAALERYKKSAQDEFANRKIIEVELEKTNELCIEHTTTITSLRSQIVQFESSFGPKYEKEVKMLKEDLEAQIRSLKQQKEEGELLLKEATKNNQEKARQISQMTFNLEEECKKRRALELELNHLKQSEADLKAKNASYVDTIQKMKVTEHETHIIKVELEELSSEKNKAEQNSARLQNRIQELQCSLDTMEAVLERYKKTAQDEFAKRMRIEAELEKMNEIFIEHTTTITSLRSQMVEIESSVGTKYEKEVKILKEDLEAQIRSLKQQKEEDKLSLKEATKNNQEKARQISQMTFNLEEECKKRRALELELNHLKQSEADLKAKNASYVDTIQKMKVTEHETHITKVELEELSSEKNKAEQNSTRLQNRIQQLQCSLDTMEAALERYKKSAQDEFANRKRIEVELEKTNELCKDHTTTITSLRSQIVQFESSFGTKSEKEVKILKEDLEAQIRSLKQHKEEGELNLKEATKNNQEKARQISQLIFNLEEECKKRRALELELNHLKQSEADLKAKNASYIDTIQKIKVTEHETHITKVELEKQSSEKNKAEQNSARLQNCIQELQCSLDTMEAALERHKRSAQDEFAKRMRIEAELEKMNNLCIENTTTITSLRSQIVEIESTSAGMKYEYEVKILKEERQKCLTEHKRTKDELNAALAEIKTLKYMLQQEQANLKANNASYIDTIQKIKVTEHETHITKVELEKQSSEKNKAEQNSARLQNRIQELQCSLDTMEAALERYKKSAQDELAKRKRTEAELEKFNEICIEHTTTITSLRSQIVEIESTSAGMKNQQEVKILKEERQKRLMELMRTKDELNAALAEIKVLKHMLMQEQSKTQELNKAGEELKEYTENEKLKVLSTVIGLRERKVTVYELIESELLCLTDLQKLFMGRLTIKDIEDKLKNYLRGSSCIAGIYSEASDRTVPFYQAMKEGLLTRGTTLVLLEAQAASGYVVDPVNNIFLTVEEAVKRGLVGKEFKEKLESAEKAVTGYTDPHNGQTISLFQAIEKELIEKGHGIRLLEAQIAAGGIIDPIHSHRIDVTVAYKRGYFDEGMNEILKYEGDDTKGFFDPNTKENLTYLQLQKRCITDPKTGLILLPLKNKYKAQKSETAFLDLSEKESKWEEITIKGSDGSAHFVIVDRKTGTQHDIKTCMERGIIEKSSLEEYRKGRLTLTQFADLITRKTDKSEINVATSSVNDIVDCKIPTHLSSPSPTLRKHNNVSIIVTPPEMFDDQSPVGAIFDTESFEKITILEALHRGIVDTITAQRLLEAQACTGGIINPDSEERLSLQDAIHQGIIDENMASKLKTAQKAFFGFEDVKTKRKMSAAEALKESWLPYETGKRFLEFQYLTGGLIEPGTGKRIDIEEAIHKGWLDGQGAQKLQDTKNHQKYLTCPKTKLKISYKEAMDACMVEESNGMKMLQASSVSTKGISSPYNLSNPGSRSGSRDGSHTGSRSGSRRGSVDNSSLKQSSALHL